jgi:predicted MFS family arabinose efflux permease
MADRVAGSGVRAAELASEAPYRALLRKPQVRWQAISGLLAQVTQGASGVGLILVIREHTGSLALAGGVVGALSIAAGVGRPLQGRLIDRRGAAGVVAIAGGGHALALGAIVWFAALHAPGIVLLALGALAGINLPPISTAMRVGWGERIDADDRTAAYSLVYLVQELAILGGPLILAAAVATAGASAAVLLIAGITATGALWFAACSASPRPQGRGRSEANVHVLRSRGVRILILIAMLLGGVIGAVEVAAPTLALSHRQPAASGLLIAALSVGGVGGAAVYASRRWQSGAAARLIALLGLLTISVSVAGTTTSLVVVGVLLLAAGLAINPTLTTISVLVDRHSPGRTAAEAFGWLSTGIAGGTGAASAIAGAVTQRGGSAGPAFLVAAVSALAAMAAAAACRSRLA